MYRFLNTLPDGALYHATLKTQAVLSRQVHRDYHPHYELYFCPLDIDQDIVINGQAYVIKQSSVIISSPFSVHGMSKYNGGSDTFPRYTVYFNDNFIKACGSGLPEGMLASCSSRIYLLTDEQRSLMSTLFESLIEAKPYPAEFTAYFVAAMNTLERTVPEEARITCGSTEYYYVVDVLKYIYDNRHRSISADKLAEHFHVSRAKLDRDFRSFVGETPHKTVTKFRVGYAVELLTRTEMKVRDIARACGFEDEYYFYAFFKNALGKTPLAVRRAGHAY